MFFKMILGNDVHDSKPKNALLAQQLPSTQTKYYKNKMPNGKRDVAR